MSPEAVRILDRLGVVPALESAGAVALAGMKLTGPRGATAHGLFGETGHRPFRATGLSVSRQVLDQELVAAARKSGAAVAERTMVEELIYDRGAVAGAVVRDGAGRRHGIRARLTVGADGLRSVVARRIGRRIHGRPRRIAFVAHPTGVQGVGSSAELHFSSHSLIGLNAIGRGRTNLTLVVSADRAAAAGGRVPQFFREAVSAFPAVQERISWAELGPILTTGPFAARSSRVVAPGAALVGDAADFFDPVTGDGIYTALRGAELLSQTVGTALSRPGPIPAEGLLEYQRMRRRIFGGKWIVERMIGFALLFPRFFDRVVARLGTRDGMAHTVIGVAGAIVPAREMLNPVFLARMVF
jgi:2-polyprenyl-6-methoxyphenol hydroxylase-like FAD-dependent oxidoreductase